VARHPNGGRDVTTNRIKEIAREDLTPQQRKVFEDIVARRGRLLGPYKIWIHSPRLAEGMETVGTFLNKQGSLSEKEVEIGVLLISDHWDADYVRNAHIELGRKAGLADREIADILAGRDPKFANPHEDAVYRFAKSLSGGGRMTDAEFNAVEQVLGRDGVAEVLVLLGYYTSVSLGMKVHQVPVGTPDPLKL
jgi:4-carboxymuconolactone decarboxylase